MGKINLTIDSTGGKGKYIKIEHLDSSGTTASGVTYIFTWQLQRYVETGKGWWFNHVTEDEFNKEILFADIVKYNGSAIGNTSYATISAAILAAILTEAQQV